MAHPAQVKRRLWSELHNDFVDKAALQAQMERGFRERLEECRDIVKRAGLVGTV